MKKLTVILGLVLVMCLLPLVSCAAPPAPMPPPAPVPPPRPAPPPAPAPASVPGPSTTHGPMIFIKVDSNLNKDVYLPGEDIVMNFAFQNVTAEPFQIDPFPPLIQISHQDEVWRSFPPGEAVKTLEPDEVTTYTLAWDQSDEQGQQVCM